MRKKKFFASVATVTVFGVFTRIISFVFKIYLSRTLGAEAIGLYQMALSVFFLFASISASGIPLVLSRKTAETIALEKRTDYSLVTSALVLGTIISSSCILVLAFTKNYLGFLFSEPAALPVFSVTIPALLSTTVYSVIRGFFWGKKRIYRFFSHGNDRRNSAYSFQRGFYKRCDKRRIRSVRGSSRFYGKRPRYCGNTFYYVLR
ncbi:MAG: oligosaccharide flippase family protein [Clostridiales bacterium]|nr:oligosaccharide flippase family protein [Clostridiales bacterium]